MSSWQRFRVELKGEAEPLEVQTDARDWAAVEIDPSAPKAMDMTFQAVWRALLRTGAQVPRDYEGFLEVLAGMPDTLEEGDPEQMDPTVPGP